MKVDVGGYQRNPLKPLFLVKIAGLLSLTGS